MEKNSNNLNGFIKGNMGEMIIESIFKEAGYEVYPFGVQNNLTRLINLKKGLIQNNVKKQIFSSPDFLILNNKEDKNELFFIECKVRKTSSNYAFFLEKWEIENYYKFWPDAYIIVITNYGNNFYVKRVGDLDISKNRFDDKDFDYLENSIFRIPKNVSEKYKPVIDLICKIRVS